MTKPLWRLRPQEKRAHQANEKKAVEAKKKSLLSKLVVKKTETAAKSKKGKSPNQDLTCTTPVPQQETERKTQPRWKSVV